MADTINQVNTSDLSKQKIDGKDVLLFLNTGTEATPIWSPVICLTSNSITKARATIDANSKCGNDQRAGLETYSVDFEGQTVGGNITGAVSTNDLDYLIKKGIIKQWMIGESIPKADSIRESFFGFLTKADEANPQDNVQTFSSTIAISGTPVREIATEGEEPTDPLEWAEYVPTWA